MAYVIGTAGHVDHGKSTLVEALTGIDPDRLAEEKAREMTIDLGFAWLTLPGGESVGVVDVPGHRDFIENMLAGVGGIDLALLVIAADEGIMPQTREHLAILDLLAVERAVVALTKTDLVDDPEWLDLVQLDIEGVLSGTTLAGSPVVPVSARTGEGIDNLLAMLQDTLADCPERVDRGKPRLPVDRVFTIAGFGTVVTGTLSGGSLQTGDEVVLVPGQREARIRGLQSHKLSVEMVEPGSRVAVNLAGIDKDEVLRGEVLTYDGVLKATRLIDVQFDYLAALDRPLLHNAEVKVFSGASETLGYARIIGDRQLNPGETGWLQLRLTDPIAVARGDRFILRYPSPPQTIGGGTILDPYPPHRWRRFKPEVLDRMTMLAAGTPEELVLNVLEGETVIAERDFPALVELNTSEAAQVLTSLIENGDVFRPGSGWIMARVAWERFSTTLNRELATFHMKNPLRLGMPREALRSRLRLESKPYNLLLKLTGEEGLTGTDGQNVFLIDHVVRFNDHQQADVDLLMREFEADPINTPSVKQCAEMVGEDVLQALIERGELVQLNADVLYDATMYERLIELVRRHIEEHGEITVAAARDLFSTSRKYVLALLEHMDSIGLTRREGDGRVLR